MIEREFVLVVADRMDRDADDVEVRMHAAAANSVFRILNEDIGAALLRGDSVESLGNPFERIAHGVRTATGGVLGDTVST